MWWTTYHDVDCVSTGEIQANPPGNDGYNKHLHIIGGGEEMDLAAPLCKGLPAA